MKKIATLILAAGLVFGAATGASAIEFNAKGQWLMQFEYGGGLNGISRDAAGATQYGAGNGTDSFEATQRIRIQLDAVASESLSGTVQFEMGNTVWGNGNAANGGALGADGTIVAVKHAYLDWIVPSTALKVRMGIHNIALPSMTFGSSQVFDADVAGIAASYQVNDNVGVTTAWMRPYNDNYAGDNTGFTPGNAAANAFDNIDIFALIVPMTFDNVKLAPWAVYAMVGRNAVGQMLNNANGFGAGATAFSLYQSILANGMLPVAFANTNSRASTYGQAYWLGLTGEVTTGSPLRFAWDANYGSFENGHAETSREGWYLDALVEYKMAWGTPGLYAWYGSGDDGSLNNGSERMPSVAADGTDQRSNLAGSGSAYIGREGVIGADFIGTWGIGARLKDMSFMEDLKHTLRVNYIAGTNSPTMARFMTGAKTFEGAGAGGGTFTSLGANAGNRGQYMTTKDNAIEVGLTSTYKIYDNLNLYSDLGYLFMSMDKDTWTDTAGNRTSYTDPWNINFTFVYSF